MYGSQEKITGPRDVVPPVWAAEEFRGGQKTGGLGAFRAFYPTGGTEGDELDVHFLDSEKQAFGASPATTGPAAAQAGHAAGRQSRGLSGREGMGLLRGHVDHFPDAALDEGDPFLQRPGQVPRSERFDLQGVTKVSARPTASTVTP